MDPQQLDEHRRALESLRARLLSAGSVAAEPVRRDAVTAADEDEQPLVEMGQSIASRQNETRARTLLQIAAALAKLERRPDDYGLCELCEEEIAPARLRALPHAERCLRCQGRAEAESAPRGRRHLTDFT